MGADAGCRALAARGWHEVGHATVPGHEPFSGSERSGMSDVLLRPEEFRYGRLRPPSRLSMNSLRSALTAVLAGQNPLAIRAKEDYERAFTRRTQHYNQADASANVRKSVDTTRRFRGPLGRQIVASG